ncbi:MAG: UDP-N-acetylmuramoyl-L-alanine--D-glutamate ligase [Clostridia bacterium]|nr:UDP-N-acetylmuramoyl-L-alanine--D-glutamate ligase [Clostridia bacterium]
MNRKFLIVGAGRSGICCAKMLLETGDDFVIYDGNPDLDTKKTEEQIGKDGLTFILDKITENDIEGIDVCAVSPGVPYDSPVLSLAREKNIPLWSEIELAYLYDKGDIIAITGTNGKTTTTSLVYEIVKAHNENTLLVGNIEIPYTGLALTSKEGGATVAEISSFQLETMVTFKPKVSAVLNITPDHLDRHKTMENYIELKKSIAKNQDENGFCVLNYDDEVLRAFGESLTNCKPLFFSAKEELENGLFYKDGTVYRAADGIATPYLTQADTNLVGVHNFENIMAAVLMTSAFGVPDETIKKAIKTFRAVEHRIEYVTEKKGVKYYNDSKGTNTDAAIKAIDAMPSTTVLIAGGYDKKSDYDEWVSHFPGKVRKLILIGQTKENIAAACEKIGFTDYIFAEDLTEAVTTAEKEAKEGDCCLLSPACASWGMFKNYQQRGDMFKELVNKI